MPAIARDVTARKRADVAFRTSELRWRSIIDSAVDGIIVIDAEGRIEAFNRGAERLFGYRGLEVIGRNVKMLMPLSYHDNTMGTMRGISKARALRHVSDERPPARAS